MEASRNACIAYGNIGHVCRRRLLIDRGGQLAWTYPGQQPTSRTGRKSARQDRPRRPAFQLASRAPPFGLTGDPERAEELRVGMGVVDHVADCDLVRHSSHGTNALKGCAK